MADNLVESEPMAALDRLEVASAWRETRTRSFSSSLCDGWTIRVHQAADARAYLLRGLCSVLLVKSTKRTGIVRLQVKGGYMYRSGIVLHRVEASSVAS